MTLFKPENSVYKLSLKYNILYKIYNPIQHELLVTIQSLVAKSAGLYNLPISLTRQYFIYFRGTKYYSKDYNNDTTAFFEQVDLHSTIKKEFIRLISIHEEIIEEEQGVNIFINALLSECHSIEDVFEVLPNTITNLLDKPNNMADSNFTDTEILKIKEKNSKYIEILSKRIFTNLLMQG